MDGTEIKSTRRQTRPGVTGSLMAIIVSAASVWLVTGGAAPNEAARDLAQMNDEAARHTAPLVVAGTTIERGVPR